MASRYFINGGVNSNWNSITNWSTSSGGAGGASVPGNTDDVFLDGNSPNCTVNVASSCANLDFTGYTNTITFNANLTANPTNTGNVKLVAAMTLAGSFNLRLVGPTAGSATLTTNGKTVNIALDLGGNGSIWTLADNLTISGTLTLGTFGAATNIVVNGNNIISTGNLGIKDRFTGTTNVKINGSGKTWTFYTSSWVKNPIIVNTSGTITVALSTADFDVTNFTVTSGTLTGAVNLTVNPGGGTHSYIG